MIIRSILLIKDRNKTEKINRNSLLITKAIEESSTIPNTQKRIEYLDYFTNNIITQFHINPSKECNQELISHMKKYLPKNSPLLIDELEKERDSKLKFLLKKKGIIGKIRFLINSN